MRTVLFICTGNIFRSMAAEYALKALLPTNERSAVGSAGIQALPQAIHPVVRMKLLEKGADPSMHVQRKLTAELLAWVDVAVAMGEDHRRFIRHTFNRDVPLFNEVCHGRSEPILDIHEAMPNWPDDPAGARQYALSVIEHIWDSMPVFLSRLPSW